MDDPLAKAAQEHKVAIRKVPGQVAPLGRLQHESASFSSEFNKMGLPRLKDALARQEKVLSNTKLLSTLPDKGEKIKAKKEHIQRLIDERTINVSDTADLLSALSISSANNNKGENPDKSTLEEMEFRLGGGLSAHLERSGRVGLDSDDDSEEEANRSDSIRDPLRLHAQKEVPEMKIGARERNAQRLPEDKGGVDDCTLPDSHSKQISFKVAKAPEDRRFMPFAQFKLDKLEELKSRPDSKAKVHSNPSPKSRTDPIPLSKAEKEGKQSNKAVMLTLQESLAIQKELAERLEEANLQKAVERLSSFAKTTTDGDLPDALRTDMRYRGEDKSDSIEEEEADEMEEEGEGGGVNITFTEYQ